MSRLADLHRTASELTLIARRLRQLGLVDTAANACLLLCTVNQSIAVMIPASNSKGRLARHGAVCAAVEAGDLDRATTLLNTYVREPGMNPKTLTAMRRLVTNLRRKIKRRMRSRVK